MGYRENVLPGAASPERASEMAGTTTERFRILRELACSPPRSVYSAKDTKTGRTVLLHSVRPGSAEAGAYESKLRQQARAASTLNSPNIPVIYGGGNQAGMFFVAVEYVEGTSLRTALSRGQRIGASEFLDLARQVCTGLDHAHHCGVFHGNLHPGNIFIELDGTAKILDFGIPKELPANDERLHYAAPEQLRGLSPDARSNLFSWGAILYEILAGRKAFVSCERDALPPSPHELDKKIPFGISDAVMKALALDPAERFGSGLDLASAMENHRAAERSPLPPPAPVLNVPLPRPQQVASAYAAMPPLTPQALANTETQLAHASQSSPAPPDLAAESANLGTLYVPPPPPPAKPKVTARAKAELKHAVRSAATNLGKPETDLRLRRVVKYAVPSMLVLTLVMVAGAIYYYIDGRIEAARAQAPVEPSAVVAAAPATSPVAEPVSATEPVTTVETVASTVKAPSVTWFKTKAKKPALPPPATPAVTTGELAISSVPEGAQIQIDGRSDPGWRTPFVAANVSAGLRTVTLTMPGYAPRTQTIQVDAARRATFAASLSETESKVAVTSNPPGAAILVDGHETGRITPAEVIVSKGEHRVTVRRAGYFDYTAEARLAPGNTVVVNAPLQVMGNAYEARSSGRFGKLLGRPSKDMGEVQIRTSPKGAKIIINNREMEKSTPAEFLLPAGHYDILVTAAGYKALRRMVSVDPGSKLVISDALER